MVAKIKRVWSECKKAVAAAIGAGATWSTVSFADGVITKQEWLALAFAVAGVWGVYQARNTNPQ